MHRWEQQSSSGTHGALAGDRDIAGEESCIWWWLRRGRCLWQATRSFCSSGMHTSDFVLLGEKSLLWPQYRKVHPKLLLLLMCLALTWSQGGPFLQAPAQKRPVAVNSCIVIRGNNFGLPPLFMQQGWIWLLFVPHGPMPPSWCLFPETPPSPLSPSWGASVQAAGVSKWELLPHSWLPGKSRLDLLGKVVTTW